VIEERGWAPPEKLRGLERAVAYRIEREEDKSLAKMILDYGYASEAAVEEAMKKQKDRYSKSGEITRLCDSPRR